MLISSTIEQNLAVESVKRSHLQATDSSINTVIISAYKSPLGNMIIGSCNSRLCICGWGSEIRHSFFVNCIKKHLKAIYKWGTTPIISQTILELDEYFAGARKVFSVPILFSGTDFQCSVWSELMKIPYGTTISYAELARRIANPDAVRAVAAANAANLLSILVPCHRVIGSNKKLIDYAGGLHIKHMLIDLEAKVSGKVLNL